MDYQNKVHAKLVVDTYKSLPNMELTNNDVYDDVCKTLDKYNGKIGNGEMLDTLKLIVLQLCESCAKFIETEKYKDIQEEYK